MNDNNLSIWLDLKSPPREALKLISGGRLKGMTDINPQWRFLAMTSHFGPCGTGWKYSIEKTWREDGANGEVMCFALINLYYKNGDLWSEPIPGIGGSTLIDKEAGGLHSCDEGYKMAITDALSVAFKALGVAADIYMGIWDGSKYRDDKLKIYDGLDDVTDSKGGSPPPVDPGVPSVRGDGVADAMRKGRIAFNNLMAEKYEGNPIFSPEELKDMNADLFPGGRILSSSQSDLDYLRAKYVKWTDRKNAILSASMDAIADEGFALSMAKE